MGCLPLVVGLSCASSRLRRQLCYETRQGEITRWISDVEASEKLLLNGVETQERGLHNPSRNGVAPDMI